MHRGAVLLLIVCCDAASTYTSSLTLLQSTRKVKKHRTTTTTQRSEHIENFDSSARKILAEKVTPEVNQTIQELVRKIETQIEANIIADANETQRALDDAVEALRDSLRPLAGLRSAAQKADASSARADADKRRQELLLNGAKNVRDAANTTKNGKCDIRDEKQMYSPSFSSVLNCDFSTGDCTTSTQDYRTAFNNWMTEEVKRIEGKFQEYETAKGTCETAKEEFDEKQNAYNAAQSAYTNEVAESDFHANAAKLDKCMFGAKLQVHCSKLDAYNALVAKISETESNHSHSDADRKSEWATVKLIKCMLQKHSQNSEFNSATMSACNAADATQDFEDKVGSTNLKASEVESLTTDYPCDANMGTINFNSSASLAFDRDVADAPFTFCAASATLTCADYFASGSTCEVAGVTYNSMPETTICNLASGCTSADCCEVPTTTTEAPAPPTTTTLAPVAGANIKSGMFITLRASASNQYVTCHQTLKVGHHNNEPFAVTRPDVDESFKWQMTKLPDELEGTVRSRNGLHPTRLSNGETLHNLVDSEHADQQTVINAGDTVFFTMTYQDSMARGSPQAVLEGRTAWLQACCNRNVRPSQFQQYVAFRWGPLYESGLFKIRKWSGGSGPIGEGDHVYIQAYGHHHNSPWCVADDSGKDGQSSATHGYDLSIARGRFETTDSTEQMGAWPGSDFIISTWQD